LTNSDTRKHLGGGEQYLQYAGRVYPEAAGSGWTTYVFDGQDRLMDYTWDDRGYVYAAYDLWGWGIIESSSFKTVRQVDWNDTPSAHAINSFKSNGRYYVIVSGTTTQIWDVTSPTSPVKVRDHVGGFHAGAVASLSSGDVIALLEGSYLNLYTGAALATGGPAFQTVDSSAGRLADVDSDGTNFYALRQVSGSAVSILKPNSGGTFFSGPTFNFPGQYASGLRYGSGHLTVWGSDKQFGNGWLYEVANNDLIPKDLGGFLQGYYTGPTTDEYYTPAVQGYSGAFSELLYARYGGKSYLLVSTKGLGDVFELESPDQIQISLDGNFGTTNPYAEPSTGYFYGDPMKFSSRYDSGSVSVNWDFGNPEGIASKNLQTATSGSSVIYQYAGLTTASSIEATKTVVVSQASKSSNKISTNVFLKAPQARLALKNTSHRFPQSDITQIDLVFGDQFVDASDGKIESHYGEWNLDGVVTFADPTYAVAAGACGDHTLSYTARYVPYTGTGTAVQPALSSSGHYTRSVGPLSYSVRPFAPAIGTTSSASTVTFQNKTRYGASAFGTGATWTANWRLLNAAGALVASETDAGSAIGTIDTFVVSKNLILAGYEVELEVSVDASAISEASCSGAGLLSATAVMELLPPDPVIGKTGCEVAKGSCKLTVTSETGADSSDWVISWYQGGNKVATGSVYEPVFQTDGSFTVEAEAVNDLGTTRTSITLQIEPSLCTGAAGAVSFGWKGNSTACRDDECSDPAETYTFTPSAWGYTFQECDQFSWDFGDGKKSTLRKPEHKYGKSGTFTVKLTVTNPNGTVTSTEKIVLGTSTEPDCYPPVAGTVPSSRAVGAGTMNNAHITTHAIAVCVGGGHGGVGHGRLRIRGARARRSFGQAAAGRD
ncbi:MAG: PKD domain-containing protein, partial [Acidobacteria bacterium]|nr:PKD domain-containing protein [Acidobacteriota bacterium]